MSRASHIAVTRDYRPAPDECARALRTLLDQPVIKKADEPAHRDGTKVKEDSADAPIIRH